MVQPTDILKVFFLKNIAGCTQNSHFNIVYKPKSLSISLFFYLLKRMFLPFHMRKNQKKSFYFNVSNDSIKDWIAFFAALEVFFSRPSSFDSLNEWTSPSLPHPIHIVPEGMLSVPPPA